METTYSTVISKNNFKLFKNHPKVLLVEDSPSIQFINRTFLEMLGCDVDLAKGGYEAINLFDEKYALVLLDVGLHDISGMEVAMKLRQKNGKNIPIVGVTAFGNQVIEECINAGMDEVFINPVLLDGLSSILKKFKKLFN